MVLVNPPAAAIGEPPRDNGGEPEKEPEHEH